MIRHSSKASRGLRIVTDQCASLFFKRFMVVMCSTRSDLGLIKALSRQPLGKSLEAEGHALFWPWEILKNNKLLAQGKYFIT